MFSTLAVFLFLGATGAHAQNGGYSGSRHLWYTTPGNNLKSGLPIGNGRLGALVHGSAVENITLNENSVWSGPFEDRINPGALEAVPVVREMLKDGEYTEAGQMTLRDITAIPSTNRWFSVTGSVILDFGHTEDGWSNYERWLDTQKGNTGVQYEVDGVMYTREYIASVDAGVIAVRLIASEEGSLSFNATWHRDRGIQGHAASEDDSTVFLDVGGDGADAIPFSAGFKVVANGGSVSEASDSVLAIEGATAVDLFVDAESSFRYGSEEDWKKELEAKLNAAVELGFDEIKSRAVEDHESLMKRVTLDIGSSGEAGLLTTDERIAAFKENSTADPEFLTLNFNYGRHLLISASRDSGPEGLGVPANLQGIWNDIYVPPWGSKYTVNINTEMNYWLAETTDLPETLQPLWDLMYRARERGAEVAERMYGCTGYVSHHNLDLWGDSCPHDNGTAYSVWPSSNLWLSLHMMERYHFSGDKEFLRETAWPLFKDIATFFDCYLFEWEGYWNTGPSVSPENVFVIPEDASEAGESEALDISPLSDTSLLHEFFTNVLEAADILEISLDDDEVLSKVESYRAGLRPIEIGARGQIMEWRKDYEEQEPGHRHISHLIELYPSTRMTPFVNETLADAARVTLDLRLAAGEPTGWARAWIAACYARLFDGDMALEQARGLLTLHPVRNLFHEHNPGGPFQIDSNFGFVSAMVEIFVQSHSGIVHLLPAVAGEMAAGSVTGVVARGGFVVDVSWEDGGALKEAKIQSRNGGKLSLLVAGGDSFKIDGEAVTTIETGAGRTYHITP